MSITMPCWADAEGNFPEGAYVLVKAVHEGDYEQTLGYDHDLKRDTIRYHAWDRQNQRTGVVTPLYGPFRRNLIVGYMPTAGATRVLAETHKGLVLSLGERNGYHDSDFYANVWNPETRKVESIEYASTRGWTYDCGAHIDATPEVRADYEAQMAYNRRHGTIMAKRAASKVRSEYARLFEVPRSTIAKLEAQYGRLSGRPIAPPSSYYSAHSRSLAISLGFMREATDLDRLLKLAASRKQNKLRSDFKKKLADQVLDWMRDPAPKYPTPLSRKQLQYI